MNERNMMPGEREENVAIGVPIPFVELLAMFREAAGNPPNRTLGKQLGVSGPTVSRWRTDADVPDDTRAKALAEVIGARVPGVDEDYVLQCFSKSRIQRATAPERSPVRTNADERLDTVEERLEVIQSTLEQLLDRLPQQAEPQGPQGGRRKPPAR